MLEEILTKIRIKKYMHTRAYIYITIFNANITYKTLRVLKFYTSGIKSYFMFTISISSVLRLYTKKDSNNYQQKFWTREVF